MPVKRRRRPKSRIDVRDRLICVGNLATKIARSIPDLTIIVPPWIPARTSTQPGAWRAGHGLRRPQEQGRDAERERSRRYDEPQMNSRATETAEIWTRCDPTIEEPLPAKPESIMISSHLGSPPNTFASSKPEKLYHHNMVTTHSTPAFRRVRKLSKPSSPWIRVEISTLSRRRKHRAE